MKIYVEKSLILCLHATLSLVSKKYYSQFFIRRVLKNFSRRNFPSILISLHLKFLIMRKLLGNIRRNSIIIFPFYFIQSFIAFSKDMKIQICIMRTFLISSHLICFQENDANQGVDTFDFQIFNFFKDVNFHF